MMALFLNPTVGLAACNWKDIKKANNGYLYPDECHRAVGIIKETNGLREKEIVQLKDQVEDLEASKLKLTKSIELKDLALDKADMQVMRWREESYRQHERLLKHDRLSRQNTWIYIGLGFLAASVSVYAAGQLNR